MPTISRAVAAGMEYTPTAMGYNRSNLMGLIHVTVNVSNLQKNQSPFGKGKKREKGVRHLFRRLFRLAFPAEQEKAPECSQQPVTSPQPTPKQTPPSPQVARTVPRRDFWERQCVQCGHVLKEKGSIQCPKCGGGRFI